MNKQEITYTLVQQLCVLEERGTWNLEFNVVSWSGEEPKYDIRPWNTDHSRCGKGITLTEESLRRLVNYCEQAQIHAI